MGNDLFNELVIKPVISSVVTYSEKNAFCIHGKYYTYADFGRYISNIRHTIQTVKDTNSCWGLVANDDIETYASIFALWLEGKAYVPLNQNHPLDRCKNIIEQVEIKHILDSSIQTKFDEEKVLLSHTFDYRETRDLQLSSYPTESLAYILFTSGSTGDPKGVTISRDNVGAFMQSFWLTGIKIVPEDRCLQCFDLTFDVSVQSYLVALTKGACVYTVPTNQVKYIYVANLIHNERITFGAMAPSMLRYMQPYFDEIDASSMKTTILTAEACPVLLMQEWFKYASNTEIFDFYGPTEATIYCTSYKLNRISNKSLNGIISIGRPLANVQAIIVDEQLNCVPTGEKGELCIAGSQVTPGYWKNSLKNKDSFFIKEVNGVKMRFYHTGDICYCEEDGNIMYAGRMDYQVKIQGYRIELSEIEFHAREFLQGVNAIALAFENELNLTEIALFVEQEKGVNKEDLIQYLRDKMPAYMIPSKFFFLPIFALNSNDKVDRIQLQKMLK